MDIRRRNNGWRVCFATAVVTATVLAAQTSDYDFQELLLGLTSDSRTAQSRAEEEVRMSLKGRERDVWNFIQLALNDAEGKYDSGHVSDALRALTLLDGFNEEIWNEYCILLRKESNEVDELRELESKRLQRVQTKDEWRSITKRMAFIEYGLYTAEELGSPLPRETVTPFLQFNDPGIIEPIIRWYHDFGIESDIEALTKRAEELAAMGGTIYRDAIAEAVTKIRTRGAAEPAPNNSPPGESSADRKALKADTDRTVPEDDRAEGVSSLRKWPYAVGILLVLGAVLFQARRASKQP